jgi:hypothetical protein
VITLDPAHPKAQLFTNTDQVVVKPKFLVSNGLYLASLKEAQKDMLIESQGR